MSWSTALTEAAEQFDGGARSFSIARYPEYRDKYPYEAPNRDYERLFLNQASASSSQQHDDHVPRCAGWLGLDTEDATVCKPLFVAHSTLAAIWLLRETLGDHTLPAGSWSRLVLAAQALTHDTVQAPPSAQVPSARSPSSAKRPSQVLQASSSKRACVRLSETPVPSHASDESDNPPTDDSPGLQELVTTVTNNNRRAEKQRTRKIESIRLSKRIGLGLRAPADKAPRQELAAYNSIAGKDEATVAWIIKQPLGSDMDFYNASPTPYFTACTLLEKVCALGNQSSRYHAARFLQTWRELGTPFQAEVNDHVPSLSPSAESAFCFAWSMCTRYDSKLAAMHIASRWAHALLGEAYTKKVEQLQMFDLLASNDHSRNRYGKGPVRTEAIAQLIKLVHPAPTRKDNEIFRTRLKQAVRWYKIVKELGWGILLLIPHEEVSNRWVERVLRVGQLDVFIRLVQRQQPDLCAASRTLENWLGPDGIAGGPISGKQTLSIEAEGLTTVYEVEEIQDSEDDGIDESVNILQPTLTPGSTARSGQLRQMSLLELFHPVPSVE
jgi:hypothetical protein